MIVRPLTGDQLRSRDSRIDRIVEVAEVSK
jgi:hypothetical protein